MPKRGRKALVPSEAIIAYLCAQIEAGRGFDSICSDENMPCSQTVRKWLSSDAELYQRYTRARLAQAELYADQIIELSDKATPADAHVRRLQVDARKWRSALLDPKSFGGQAGGITINNNVQVLVTEEKRQELIQRRQQLLKASIVQPSLTEGDTQ